MTEQKQQQRHSQGQNRHHLTWMSVRIVHSKSCWLHLLIRNCCPWCLKFLIVYLKYQISLPEILWNDKLFVLVCVYMCPVEWELMHSVNCLLWSSSMTTLNCFTLFTASVFFSHISSVKIHYSLFYSWTPSFLSHFSVFHPPRYLSFPDAEFQVQCIPSV